LGFSVVHFGSGGFTGFPQPSKQIIANKLQLRTDIYTLLSKP
jgi:hypothetical protein